MDFNKMLGNENVNALSVAVIFGFATYNFFNTVGTMLFGDWFNSGASWSWSSFWTALVVYVVLILVAWWVSTMSKR